MLSLGTSTVHVIAIVCFLSLIKKLTAMTHGGMPHAAVVAHGGCWATPCRRRWHCVPHGDILTAVGHGD
jgi:hypothetical protein